MKEDINVWLFPLTDEIVVTDQTGGVPVDCCNLPEYESKRLEILTGSQGVLYRFDEWGKAVKFVDELVKEKLRGWQVTYD